MKIETKKAYLVRAWYADVIEGQAFETIINDFGENRGYMFSDDNCKTFRFIKTYNSDKVYFDLIEAEKGVKQQIKEAKEFYSKQIEEYKEKLSRYDRN